MRVLKPVLFAVAVAALSLSVFPVAAQIAPAPCTGLGINCGGAANSLSKYIVKIIELFLTLVGLIAAIMVIYGGVKYMLSAGDSKEAETAKHINFFALIGLIIVGLSAVIVNFIVGAL